VIAIPLAFLLIGIPLVAIAAYVIWRANTIRKAVLMVSEPPFAQAATP
jgi:hypothetical protein